MVTRSRESAGRICCDLLDPSGEPHFQVTHPARQDSLSDQLLPGAETGFPGLDLHEDHVVDLLALVEAVEDHKVDRGAEEPGIPGIEPAHELG